MNIKRLKQVSYYGWQHAGEIAAAESKNIFFKIKIFFDILYCFHHYKMWSNQYKKEKFYLLTSDERRTLGSKYREEGIKRDEWQKDFVETRKFLIKYTNIKYELSHLREARNKAYAKRFNAGKNLFVEYDVNISRQHYLYGEIIIGENVTLAKHAFLDYSGYLIIKDNVIISDGVMIESHEHPTYTNPAVDKNVVVPKSLIVEEGVIIGVRAIINASVGSIGRYSRIGAGAVVRQSVPPYAIVMGNPAKVVGFSLTPEQMVEFEKGKYSIEDRLSVEKYTKDYNKMFLNRIEVIQKIVKKLC